MILLLSIFGVAMYLFNSVPNGETHTGDGDHYGEIHPSGSANTSIPAHVAGLTGLVSTSGSVYTTSSAHTMKSGALLIPYRLLDKERYLSEDRSWGAVIRVFPDSKGNIWVLKWCGRNTCLGSDLDSILKFIANGSFLKSLGSGPQGFFIDREDNIWVTDAVGLWIPDAQIYLDKEMTKGHVVMKFSSDGELLLTLSYQGNPADGPGQFNQSSDVVVAKDGHIFVADGHQLSGNNRFVKFTSDDEYVLDWGKEGSDLGQFLYPYAIALDSRGIVFVDDRRNNRIQISSSLYTVGNSPVKYLQDLKCTLTLMGICNDALALHYNSSSGREKGKIRKSIEQLNVKEVYI